MSCLCCKIEFVGMIGTPLPSPAVTPSPRRGKAILGSTLEGELSNEVRMRERFSKQISLSLPPSLVMLVPPKSRLPARSVLLLCRGLHRRPAPRQRKAIIIASQTRHFTLCVLHFAFNSTNTNLYNYLYLKNVGLILICFACGENGS